MLFSDLSNRLVVMPERRRPLPPVQKHQKGGARLRHRSAEPAVAWTHLQQLGTPRPPRSAELFEMRDASPWGGCPLRAVLSPWPRRQNPVPLASMPVPKL